MFRKLDDWLNEHIPWTPNFCIAMAALSAVVVLAGGEPITGLTIIGCCLWLAFR